jgi:hypothetical protein
LGTPKNCHKFSAKLSIQNVDDLVSEGCPTNIGVCSGLGKISGEVTIKQQHALLGPS